MMYNGHSFPVEKTAGYSTYIRLRLFLSGYPLPAELYAVEHAFDEWVEKCEKTEDYGKKYPIYSKNISSKYSVPQIEVRFDIITAPESIIDDLFTLLDKKFVQCWCTKKIMRAVIGYYNIL